MDQEVGRTINVPFVSLSAADPTPNGSEAAANESCDRLGERQLAEGSGARLASPEFIVPIAVLIVFNLVVVLGNTLVILAVSTHVKLRTATNTFIISLAVADLLVGLTVLPFSSANEVLRYWPFGMTWCNIWLAIDVWMCTASILSLCAISLDRYLAISRPFKYPRLMSQARASLLVAGVWLLSFLICFPPLIGWKEGDQWSANGTSGIPPPPASANVSGFAGPDVPPAPTVGCPALEPVVCELTSEPGYIIYSALGSFWIPVWIMTFFYWKIYRTAAKTTGAIRRGVLTTRTGCTQNSPDAEVTLRVHRGGASGDSTKYKYRMNNDHPTGGRHLVDVSPTTARTAMRKSSKTLSIEGDTYHQQQLQPKPGNGHRPDDSPGAGERNGYFHRNNRIRKQQKQPKIRIKFSKPQTNGIHGIQTAYGERQPLKAGRERRPSPAPGCYDDSDRDDCRPEVAERGPASAEDGASDGRTGGGGGGGFLNKVSRIQFRTHMKRMNKEKKAAKTVGIIVGCFVVCWAPFFTVYLLGAFCPDCTPATLFTVFFWLGYCNSAVNPCLYAMCSKDFRYAFKKLLRCRVERRQTGRRGTRFVNFLNSIRIQISTRGSDSLSE